MRVVPRWGGEISGYWLKPTIERQSVQRLSELEYPTRDKGQTIRRLHRIPASNKAAAGAQRQSGVQRSALHNGEQLRPNWLRRRHGTKC
eukprot:5049713-Pleurochrysis_carterae.AAC.1